MQGESWRRAAARRRRLRALCSRCAQEIRAGETLWVRSGEIVCTDCFAAFARDALRPYEHTLGEERAEE